MSRFLSMIVVAGACLSLGGCAHEQAPAGFAWSFQENPGEGVKLAYGQPRSDNVLLMMTCEPGSARVQLSALSGAGGEAIVLTTGEGRDRFEGEASVFGGAPLVEAEAVADARSLRAFARTGDLALMDGRRRIDVAAAPAEQAGVKRFFRACRA